MTIPATPEMPGQPHTEAEEELARYIGQIRRMGLQLRQTSTQIETSIVEVCSSFYGIAERARTTVACATGFLGDDPEGAGPAARNKSFESLLEDCSATLVSVLNATIEAGEVSRRAIERLRQTDHAALQIRSALGKLEEITKGNNILALNARIEASRAGSMGAGFVAVAVELSSQTQKARVVTDQLDELVSSLQALAQSTVDDLQKMNERERRRVERCRREIDATLGELQTAHDRMKQMLTSVAKDGALLASDIGATVRSLQFQDRISQRIAHVVQDLETIEQRLLAGYTEGAGLIGGEMGFSTYTMREERAVAGLSEAEAGAGDIELF